MGVPSLYTAKKIFRAFGVFLLLISLLLFLSPFGNFWGLAYGIVFLLGFTGYWFLLPSLAILAFLMIIKGRVKQYFNIHFVLGYIALFLGIGFLFALISLGEETDFNQILSTFDFAAFKEGSKTTISLIVNREFAGGILFGGLVSLINHAGIAFTIVVLSVLLLVSLFLILYRPLWHSLILSALKKSGQKEALKASKKQEEANITQNEEVYEYSPLLDMDYPTPIAYKEEVSEEKEPAPLKETSAIPSRSAHNENPNYVPPLVDDFGFSEPSLETTSSFEPSDPIFDFDIENPSAATTAKAESASFDPTSPFIQVSSFDDGKKEQEAASNSLQSSAGASDEHSLASRQEKNDVFNEYNSFSEEEYAKKVDPLHVEKLNNENHSLDSSSFVNETQDFERSYINEDEQEHSTKEVTEQSSNYQDSYEEVIQDSRANKYLNENALLQEEIRDVAEEKEAIEKEKSQDEFEDFKPLTEREKRLQALHQPKEFAYPPFELPPLSLLADPKPSETYEQNKAACETNVMILNQAFSDLQVHAKVIGYTIGPSVTRYDVLPDASSSLKSIERIIPDLSQRLRGTAARFNELIRGKNTSGLEVPNEKTDTVYFKEVLNALPQGSDKNMYIPFGKNIDGEIVSGDLSEFPHMLISGTSGSGKSVYAHSVLLSLIMRNRPEDLKLVLVDPKKVEMTHYEELPHLLCPIIIDPNEAKVCLDKLIVEMERRYELFSFFKVRNIRSYNEEIAAREHLAKLPFIVCFIDEFSDLINVCKNVQESVVRLAQKARAAGIHLIIATQYPVVSVIPGTIKANMSCRVALSMKSAQESLTILNESGAEDLIGHGDLLVSCDKVSRFGLVRAQGCFTSDSEIDIVADFVRKQMKPCYDPLFLDLTDHEAQNSEVAESPQIDRSAMKAASDAELYENVKEFVYAQEYTSISKLQRQFSIGFGRAGKVIKKLQDDGIVALQPDTPSSAKGLRVLKHQSEKPSTIELMGDNF